MKKWILICSLTWWTWLTVHADHRILIPQVKSLQVSVNGLWRNMPVMTLGSNDRLHVGFDELSHELHNYTYHIEHCEADWTTSEGIFESDFLEGINHNPIEHYEKSINTTVEYIHYSLELPNEQCRLTMSGNYRITITDDDFDDERVAIIEFMVVEPLVPIGLKVSTNTDIDVNASHQQLSIDANINALRVPHLEDQLIVVALQNGQWNEARSGMAPDIRSTQTLAWHHCRDLIFDAGNEYRKFETLSTSHATMGIDHMLWDGKHFHAYIVTDEVRKNYLYDQDANGYSLIRNSENYENDYSSDYVYVHYRLFAPYMDHEQFMISGHWTNEATTDDYTMTYNMQEGCYESCILQKQGYYSYRYEVLTADGLRLPSPTEGNFYQTENQYEVLIYYKGTGERTWRLVGYAQTAFHP